MDPSQLLPLLAVAGAVAASAAVAMTAVFPRRHKAILIGLTAAAAICALWLVRANLGMELKLLIGGIVLFGLAKVLRALRPAPATPEGRPAAAVRRYNEVYEWIETGWSAVLLASFLMYFFVQAFKIPSGSMRTTFLEGDHLFVNKFAYGFHIPASGGQRFWALGQVRPGDIIVFRCPPAALTPSERRDGIAKDFIKRCVAVGGDLVEIRDKQLFVNGRPRTEPYAAFVDETVYPTLRVFPTKEQYQRAWESGRFDVLPPNVVRDNFGPVVVPPGHYFVLGDNRDRSFDSRFWGPLPDHFLKGKALFAYWPPQRVRLIRHADFAKEGL